MAKASNLEDTFNKLEAVLNEMEQGELTLDESFKKYKEGMELLNKCNTMLDKVEKQIVIIDDNGDGVDAYKDIIEEEMTIEHYYAPASVNRAKASSLASLAEIYYKEGKTETAAEHAPEYLRLSQAERELKEKMERTKDAGNNL